MVRSRKGSVPGHEGSQWSAFEPVLDRRGSTQITVAPLLWASMMRWACGLK